MLKNIKEFYGNQLNAADGDIGPVKDFYFDDQAWAIRYVIANTGSWLKDRLVLLSPRAFVRPDRNGKVMHVNLTMKQIEDSPSVDHHRPISRQYEEDYHRYYGWPTYWQGGEMWGLSGFPVVTESPAENPPHHHGHQQRDDLHLRSAKAVTGYHVQATDGVLGSVSGFMVDDKSWAVGKLIVETGLWFWRKETLISSGHIKRISYEESKIYVNMTMAEIKKAAANTLNPTTQKTS